MNAIQRLLEKTHPFECPECGVERRFRTKFGGAWAVFRHFDKKHPDVSEEIGNPFEDRSAPEFENGRPAEAEQD